MSVNVSFGKCVCHRPLSSCQHLSLDPRPLSQTPTYNADKVSYPLSFVGWPKRAAVTGVG